MARLKTGDVLTAGHWNRHEEVAEWYFTHVAGGAARGGAPSFTDGTKIRLKNSSGADRRRGEILQVGDYLLGQADRKLLYFDSDEHDGTDAPFAVLLEPIRDGQIGLAQIAGVCPALVNVTHASQGYARPAASNDVLQGGALGQVRILHKPSGTGEKECLVLLGDGRFEALGESDEAIAGSGASAGTVNILDGALADTGIDEECYVLGEDGAPINVNGGISLIHNKLWFTPVDGCV